MTDSIADAAQASATAYSLRTATDPYSFHDSLRAGDGSPVWDEEAKGWLIFRFDQCAEMQRDESIFANAYRHADATIRAIKGGGSNITLSQGKEHDTLRKFHLKLLSPSHVERYRPRHVSRVITATLDRIGDRATVEACAEIADRIPPRVICSMLGIPHTDDDAMQRLLNLNHEIVMLIQSGYTDPVYRRRALAASAELNEVLRPYVVRSRDNPADDFISRVWKEAPENGITLDVDAALGLCRELYFAGSDTTVYGIANALYTLLANPETKEGLRIDRARTIAAVVEESLRLYGVVQYRQRICVQDVRIGKTEIKSGQTVYLLTAAANRDPDHYACPAQLDLGRRSPTDHLAFGRGSRSCVGSQLARLELREVLDQMLQRWPAMRLDPECPPPSFTGIIHRQVRPLNLRLVD